jgi:hypothetical protein
MTQTGKENNKMDFDKLIAFYKKKATRIEVFGDKPSRNLRVVVRIAGYEFLEEEWVNIDSEMQSTIAHYVLEELNNTF